MKRILLVLAVLFLAQLACGETSAVVQEDYLSFSATVVDADATIIPEGEWVHLKGPYEYKAPSLQTGWDDAKVREGSFGKVQYMFGARNWRNVEQGEVLILTITFNEEVDDHYFWNKGGQLYMLQPEE